MIGELAGLGAAMCWAVTAVAFAGAGRRVGSHTVNSLRLLFAIGFLGGLMLLLGQQPWPWEMHLEPLAWLALSGVVGLSLGDAALFHAYVVIGPRLGSLTMALWPAVAAVLGLALLGEQLGPFAVLGMAITLGAVAFVVFERQRTPADKPEPESAPPSQTSPHSDDGALDKPTAVESASRRRFLFGIACALGGVAGQATGIVLSKFAMVGAEARGIDAIDPLAATFTRMLWATATIWIWVGATGTTRRVTGALRNRAARWLTLLGAIFGPFLGVWLSLVSALNTELGIAGTLMATSPIWVIPLVMIIHRERVTWRALLGAAVAMGGVALLFVRAG